MKIIRVNGGLGNQLFQYVFYRYIEQNTGDICYLDDRGFSYGSKDKHVMGYQIDRIFGTTTNLLSNFFEPDLWQEMLATSRENINIVDYLNQAGLEMGLIQEGNDYVDGVRNFKQPFQGEGRSIPYNSYSLEVLSPADGNIYYCGYWINMCYFQNVRDQIVSELIFPAFTDRYNKEIHQEIVNSHSVGIHIRRGDFIKIGWVLGTEFYKSAVNRIKRTISNPHFFLFSDDLEWCRNNLNTMGLDNLDTVTFVTENDGNGQSNYRDMQHMTHCKNLIIANSSFSYFAALMNQVPNKYVITPSSGREIM